MNVQDLVLTQPAGLYQNQTLQTAPHKKQQSMPRPKGSHILL